MKATIAITILGIAVLARAAPNYAASFPCVKSCAEELNWSCSESGVAGFESCLETSSCPKSTKDEIYQLVSRHCANDKAHITAPPAPTATTFEKHKEMKRGWGPWSGSGPHGDEPWTSWTGTGDWPTTGIYSNWSPGSPGSGPFNGRWGPWGTSGPWTDGPWTSWWGDDCPDGAWSGWTSGPWSTNAPWTTWGACSASTTTSTTYTTTASGSVITGTSLGIQVAQVATTSTNDGVTSVPSEMFKLLLAPAGAIVWNVLW
ncbi:hypothetical protein BJ875DRAFT_497516 [Amylocarpus encephaloides]|uniref:Extracellular membrane protein CFEM domain-containing protein n=1 Tax=Amylocarpus encephaloides TaxID=45428 RepID=A0A9P8C3B5_9HELO|nr:hypothetical protein BJ875DRAFT_497516 [Amylocarpus encephaloides]